MFECLFSLYHWVSNELSDFYKSKIFIHVHERKSYAKLYSLSINAIT